VTKGFVHREESMPVQLFTEAERARRNRFPAEVAAEGVIRCFTLSDADRSQTPVYSAAHNRLGFALQLCALRLMGFVPDDLSSAPAAVVAYVARQLEVEPEALADYGPVSIHARITCKRFKRTSATAARRRPKRLWQPL
jgi:hypothetical protein